jgi:hypothetical protein
VVRDLLPTASQVVGIIHVLVSTSSQSEEFDLLSLSEHNLRSSTGFHRGYARCLRKLWQPDKRRPQVKAVDQDGERSAVSVGTQLCTVV